MEASSRSCENGDGDGNCTLHYHSEDPIFTASSPRLSSQTQLLKQRSASSTKDRPSSLPANHESNNGHPAPMQKQDATLPECDPDDRGLRRIIRNFTPSYVHLNRDPMLCSRDLDHALEVKPLAYTD